MSDDTDSSTKSGSFLESLGDELGFDIDRIQAEIHGEQHDTGPTTTSKGPIQHPTDEEIVEAAVSTLIDHKQRDASHDRPDVEDHRSIEVELDIEDPHFVIHQFAKELHNTKDDLLGYLYENSLFDANGPSLEDDDAELITYIIEERDEADRPAAFVGGATPLRMNLASRAGFTEDETRLVKLAHTIAARKNGYDRHLLLDEVAIVPLSDPGDNPYQPE